jgi:hypothetical protein
MSASFETAAVLTSGAFNFSSLTWKTVTERYFVLHGTRGWTYDFTVQANDDLVSEFYNADRELLTWGQGRYVSKPLELEGDKIYVRVKFPYPEYTPEYVQSDFSIHIAKVTIMKCEYIPLYGYGRSEEQYE